MTFEIQLIGGPRVRAPIAPQHLDTVLEAFNGFRSGSRVLLQGVGKYNRNMRLLEIESVEHISLLDALDVPARLDELRVLRDGWLDGIGRAPTRKGLDWLAGAFTDRYPDDLRLPFIYPTAEGGIQAEWSLDPHEITLEIDLVSHQGEWHALNMVTGDEEARDLDLDAIEAWQWLAAQIRQRAGGEA
jgi:hypothetical protein